jgi:hypothetical protein
MFHEHSGRLRWHRSRLEAATFHMCWPRTRVYLYSPDYGMWKVDTATGEGASLNTGGLTVLMGMSGRTMSFRV